MTIIGEFYAVDTLMIPLKGPLKIDLKKDYYFYILKGVDVLIKFQTHFIFHSVSL